MLRSCVKNNNYSSAFSIDIGATGRLKIVVVFFKCLSRGQASGPIIRGYVAGIPYQIFKSAASRDSNLIKGCLNYFSTIFWTSYYFRWVCVSVSECACV